MVRPPLRSIALLLACVSSAIAQPSFTTILGASPPPNGMPATQSIRIGSFLPLGSSEYLVSSTSEAWKMSIGGTLTRVLGSGTTGYLDTNENPLTADLQIGPTALSPSGEWYWIEGSTIRKLNKVTGKVETVAGNSTPGYAGDNGDALLANFAFPSDLIFGPDGNLYICDDDNYRVRKVDMVTKKVTTVAGNGSSAYNGDNIAATSAAIWPHSIAFDPAGNMLIMDLFRIRKVSGGTISTICGDGNGYSSGDGGLASAATFAGSFGAFIRCDLAGNIYFSEPARIRKIAATTGIITTYAGNGSSGYAGDGGPATDANLQFAPSHLSLDLAGNLYLAESDNSAVRKVDATSGVISTIAGNGKTGFYSGDGPYTVNSLLSDPWGIKLKGTKLYVASQSLNRVFLIDLATHQMTTIAGTGTVGFSGDGGPATSAKLNRPQDIEVDATGNVYIADFLNRRIRKVAAGTGVITTIAGTGSPGFNGENIPAISSNMGPSALLMRGSDQLLYYDLTANRIRTLNLTSGLVSTLVGNGTSGFTGNGGPAISASIAPGRCLTLSGDSVLYFAETFSSAVRKVNLISGKIFAVAGTGISGYEGENLVATQTRLNLPAGVAVMPDGNVLIADTFNDRIRMVDKNGKITTVAGNGIRGDEGDGLAKTLKVSLPRSIVMTEDGDAIFSESFGHKLRRLTFTENITAIEDEAAVQVYCYPVPATSQITVESTHGNIESVLIFNAEGKLVYSNYPNAPKTDCNLNYLPSGLYLLRSVQNGHTETKRIILLGQ